MHDKKIRQEYIYVRNMPKARKGFSEKVIRKRLEKQGYLVWRGGFLYAAKIQDPFPNVLKKYTLLEELLDRYMPDTSESLQYMSRVNHGMPDFLAFRHGHFKFVECKLIYEQLSWRQRICISKLQDMGFCVEIHRVVDERTKVKESMLDLMTGKKKILVRQERLKITKICYKELSPT